MYDARTNFRNEVKDGARAGNFREKYIKQPFLERARLLRRRYGQAIKNGLRSTLSVLKCNMIVKEVLAHENAP